MKNTTPLHLPDNLMAILATDGFWESEAFDPITITIEKISYKGQEMLSYQAAFEVLDEYPAIDGDDWEVLMRLFIAETEPNLEQRIKGDSESATCVLWTDNEDDFRLLLTYMLALLDDETAIERILEKNASG